MSLHQNISDIIITAFKREIKMIAIEPKAKANMAKRYLRKDTGSQQSKNMNENKVLVQNIRPNCCLD